jgi:hypothetical protein
MMDKTKHAFLLDLFVTEGFHVVTREDQPVEIGAINTLADHGHEVIGWLQDKRGVKTSMHWDLEGKMMGWHTGLFPYDLFLVMK